MYYSNSDHGEQTLWFSSRKVSAEEICIAAAIKCGILPVYHNLFSLASEDFTFWFHPNYIFNTEETEDLLVHYRVRFFFQNWYGKDNRRSHRYSLSKSRLGAVLDCNVINYLFAQSRSDFIHGHPEVCPSLKMHDECLGMAILDMLRIAKESKQNLQDVCREISYKSCLPESHRHEIQKQHALARYRIRKTLKRYLRQLSNCQADELSLKLKYLLDLETVTPSFGTEQFQVWNPNSIHQGDNVALQLIQVSGESGIQYRSTDASEWQTFCDFQEIIDISIKQAGRDRLTLESRVVTVTRQDSRFLEAEFQTLKEALSFVSLIDGYFRLIMDSLHYFCEEVAPPTILEDLENCCHGPITSEFAINKLKRAGAKAGMFLIRRSPKEFNDYFITICVKTPHGIEYKDCLLRKDCSFHLFGVTRNFNNLKELILYYQNNGLTIAGLPVDLKTWCSPQPKELTNLIVVRSNCSLEAPASPSLPCRQPINVQFQMVKKEDLRWGENLGQGSFTKIFQGCKMDNRDGEVHETEVLLKVLDTPHKSCWESFFEAASVMSQLSHKHLILVYGICIHGSENVMVQEYVKYGALDLFLKRNRSTVQVRWKLDVARQLACALNYLEDKKIVHGNIRAKNLLLSREGDATTGSPPFIKLSDPGISVGVLTREVVWDRIPWVAPELVECPALPVLESDKWSFGATLWEIFNSGEVPLLGRDLESKQRFYKDQMQLPAPRWTELANLITRCMQYQPSLRPSFRAIIRQLNNLFTSDYELLLEQQYCPQQEDTYWRYVNLSDSRDPLLYEERHFRYIYLLGKGNFGSVELCRYDPLGDNTGELVAVKRLQQSKNEHLGQFEKEIGIMRSLHNEHIVKYKGVCYSMGRQNVKLVMEYLPYGSLPGYLDKNKEWVNSKRLLLYALQICKGMEYLQTMRYVHRDLAARNVLVASDTLVKIADFGLTKVLPIDKDYYRVQHPGESPIFWYSPESIAECRFSPKSDVWSFGIVLHELFSFCERRRSPKQLYLQQIGSDRVGFIISVHLLQLFESNWRLPAPSLHLPEVYSLMRRCWSQKPEDRPSFAQLHQEIMLLRDERETSKG
ncbi:tyrosine-protein kinase JAK2 [Erpetoichthys calabaricus]|uniref:tyrosine-protein kinase JAK2 n=1 Tax=Erpetoichthys calabaricus TaxID=27687 RepID=UPI0022344657|nr:tyrosine-protein kinase JAK2 [Erpetoichthys calabaricus]